MIAPYDEPDIRADEQIIRRINPQHHVVPDDNRQCRRISSKAYKPSSEPNAGMSNAGMSIDIEKLIVRAGHEPQKYVVTPVYTGAVVFSANDIRSLGLWIGYEPVAGNPYHGEVWGQTPSRHNKFTQSQVRGLASAAAWYVPLNGVRLI